MSDEKGELVNDTVTFDVALTFLMVEMWSRRLLCIRCTGSGTLDNYSDDPSTQRYSIPAKAISLKIQIQQVNVRDQFFLPQQEAGNFDSPSAGIVLAQFIGGTKLGAIQVFRKWCS